MNTPMIILTSHAKFRRILWLENRSLLVHNLTVRATMVKLVISKSPSFC